MSLSDAKPKKITDPSQVGGGNLSPLFANRFYVLVRPDFTRVAFGEFVVGDPDVHTKYHSAVVVPTENALQLANLILELHRKHVLGAQAPTDADDGSN